MRVTMVTECNQSNPNLQTPLQPDQRAQAGLMGDPMAMGGLAAGQEQANAAAAAAAGAQGMAGAPGMAGQEDYIWTTLIPLQQAAAVMRQHLELAQHQTIINPVSILTRRHIRRH